MMSEEKVATGEPTKAVDLSVDDSLKVNIADALNEQDVVKFTVRTVTTLDRFKKRDFQVTRQHEEFVWLHDRFVENEENAGYIIPPCPPKPDFSQSHGKLAKLTAGDPSMTQEEIDKLKQEIQGEYLAAFQKTVAMHEVFLMRLASHPILREDTQLQAFLEYDEDLRARGRTNKEKAKGFFSKLTKAVDSSFDKHNDTDEFYAQQKHFITFYNSTVKEAKSKAETKVKKRQTLVLAEGKAAISMVHFGHTQTSHQTFADVVRKVGESHTKLEVIEKKLAAKEDLKLTDLLRYYVADGQAAKDLMWRRIKASNDVDSKTRAHEQAKLKGKKVVEAQEALATAEKKFDSINKTAKDELITFKKRRVAAFRKGIIQYTQCQIRQAKEQYALWKETLSQISSFIED